MQVTHMKAVFDRLGASDDLVNIKSALHMICSEFGSVHRLDVLLARQGSKRQALCFLRMEKTEHEQQIMRLLEITRFAGDLVVVVDLPQQAQAPLARVNQAARAQALASA